MTRMADLPEKITVRWGKSGDVRVSSPDGRYVSPDTEGEYTLSVSAARGFSEDRTEGRGDMTDDEALETLFAMANVQDGYAKKATDPGLKIIHKANAKAQREVAATIKDLHDRFAAELAEARKKVEALREALRAEHAYWDAKAAADLRLQDAGEVAMDYPMPRRMTEAMRKADDLAAALAAAEEPKP